MPAAKCRTPTTIVVSFESPYAPFLDSVSQPLLGPASPAAVEVAGPNFGLAPDGTGLFMVESYEVTAQVRIVRNSDYYWAPGAFEHQGSALLDALTFRIVPEPGTRMAALQAGKVDMIQNALPQDVDGLRESLEMTLPEGVVAGGTVDDDQCHPAADGRCRDSAGVVIRRRRGGVAPGRMAGPV